jgi:hemoglobin-like flavoprotein
MNHDDAAQREDDEQVARRCQAQIAHDLNRVLDRYEHVGADTGPVFGRYLILATLTELLGDRLKAAIAADDERARPWIAQVLARLEDHVMRTPDPRLH